MVATEVTVAGTVVVEVVKVMGAIVAVPMAIGLAIMAMSMALMVVRAKAMEPRTTLPAAIRAAWMIALAVLMAMGMPRDNGKSPRHRL
jgi:ABC-type nickel/cobalt efflux system permease component RcnA